VRHANGTRDSAQRQRLDAFLLEDLLGGLQNGRAQIAVNRAAKLLEIGTAFLFGVLVLYTLLARPEWSIMGVRLVVDAGLLLIVLVSLAIRKPFTLQYAREQVPQEFWTSREFLRTNDVITSVWALAFAAMVAADWVLLTRPDVPPKFGIIATVLALVGAIKFTGWYPDRRGAPAQPNPQTR
jgi:hypothetical protein